MRGPITLSSSRKYFNELIKLARLLLRDDSLVCFLPTLPVIDSLEDIKIDESILISAHTVKIDRSETVIVYNPIQISENISKEIQYAINNNKVLYFVFEPDQSVMHCFDEALSNGHTVKIQKEYNNTFKDGIYKCIVE